MQSGLSSRVYITLLHTSGHRPDLDLTSIAFALYRFDAEFI